jgi:hypothetical protein
MSIEFTTASVEPPIVEFSYDVSELQNLFDGYQSWDPNLDLKGLGYPALSKRLMRSGNVIDSLGWWNFKQAIENSKYDLVQKFLSIDTQLRWPNIPEQISNRIIIYRSLVADLSGYSMPPHVDNRSVYAAGYLNIFDNNPVTEVQGQKTPLFSLKKSSDYLAPGKAGQGVIWLNTEKSLHWVNEVTRDRRVLMLSLQIVPWS